MVVVMVMLVFKYTHINLILSSEMIISLEFQGCILNSKFIFPPPLPLGDIFSPDENFSAFFSHSTSVFFAIVYILSQLREKICLFPLISYPFNHIFPPNNMIFCHIFFSLGEGGGSNIKIFTPVEFKMIFFPILNLNRFPTPHFEYIRELFSFLNFRVLFSPFEQISGPLFLLAF